MASALFAAAMFMGVTGGTIDQFSEQVACIGLVMYLMWVWSPETFQRRVRARRPGSLRGLANYMAWSATLGVVVVVIGVHLVPR